MERLPTSLDQKQNIDSREKLPVPEQANYEGNWTEAEYIRLLDPVMKVRYVATKTEHAPHTFHQPSGDRYEKKTELTAEEFAQALGEYDEAIHEVFASTAYGPAKEFQFRSPRDLGFSTGFRDPGTVFQDAVTREGVPLTARQKGIIEAHEKLHSVMRLLTERERKELSPIRGFAAKIGYGEKRGADELLARMGQLKNYFGFQAGEEFTRGHLDYARAQYVHDTGLDNNMTELFAAVAKDEKSMQKFLALMNKYAC